MAGQDRAKKTEVWLIKQDYIAKPGSYDIISTPSRPLSSVLIDGDKKDSLREDTIRFLDAEHWYISKGIPYRRGYLLHGPPGCGKSSLVTALAGDFRLPIIVITLNGTRMDDQMLMACLRATPRDSLILIEDVDCAVPPDRERQRAGDADSNGTANAFRLPFRDY